MKKTLLTTAAIATAFALASSSQDSGAAMTGEMNGDHQGMEKCAGQFVAVGKNDCAILKGKHSCSGQSTDRNPDEWIYLPKGICDKIADGKVVD